MLAKATIKYNIYSIYYYYECDYDNNINHDDYYHNDYEYSRLPITNTTHNNNNKNNSSSNNNSNYDDGDDDYYYEYDYAQ